DLDPSGSPCDIINLQPPYIINPTATKEAILSNTSTTTMAIYPDATSQSNRSTPSSPASMGPIISHSSLSVRYLYQTGRPKTDPLQVAGRAALTAEGITNAEVDSRLVNIANITTNRLITVLLPAPSS